MRPAFADDIYGSCTIDGEQQKANEMIGRLSLDSIERSNQEICSSSLAQRRSAQLPKLKEIANRPRLYSADNSARSEMNDFEFDYSDCDTYSAELAELYTYSEMEDWAHNMHAFRNFIDSKQITNKWSALSESDQIAILYELIEKLDLTDAGSRLDAARCILYILQGAYMDFVDERDVNIDEMYESKNCGTGGHEEHCLTQSIFNAYRAYEAGAYQALCKLLMIEINESWDTGMSTHSRCSRSSSVSNSRSASNIDLSENADRKVRRSATMVDNEALRVVLSSIYHILESIRRCDLFDLVIPVDKKEYYSKLRRGFLIELEQPIEHANMPLIMVLLEMMPSFCHGTNPHFPMKKVLLLVWKSLLAILGGWKELREQKIARRLAANLSEIEDTLTVASSMKASTIIGVDSEQNQAIIRPKRAAHPSARLICRQLACTSTDFLEKNDANDFAADTVGDIDRLDAEYADSPSLLDTTLTEATSPLLADEVAASEKNSDETSSAASESSSSATLSNQTRRSNPLMRSNNSGDHTPVAATPPIIESVFRASLPWTSKVREDDIEAFLQHERMKFFNYQLPGDSTTVFGLPDPIQKSVEALRRHLYVSLGELQANNEKKYNRYIFSQRESDVPLTATEKLYQMMLPNLSQYIIALLKVLLAAAPSSKAKSEAINILSDILTPETDNNEILSNSVNFDSSVTNILEQNVKVAIDVNRHKEIMVKAASAILILMMKHFRLNHIYQFEYLGQHLVFANCIPLILKFFDQNMVRYIQSKHELPPHSYPYAPLYFARNYEEWPTLSIDNLADFDSQSSSYYLWRNVFSTMNLLRVLNKLTKWKHARTMMLVVFKSAPILKRSLRVKLAVFQLYVLKLLKMQARYLGRQWRRSNMEIMSAIYAKVRHRLNDDWAFANETRSKSWDFQNEEAALKTAVERFNSRRYSHLYPAFALEVGESRSPGDSYLDAVDLREFEPVDNSFQSLLGKNREMSDCFKRFYTKWVDDQVMNNEVDWDLLLSSTRGIV